MTPLKYGDKVLSFGLNLHWNGGVDPRCGCKRPVKALFLSSCHCHNSKVSQQESSIFVFLHLVNSNCLTAPLVPPLEQFTLVVLWLFSFILWVCFRCGDGRRSMEGGVRVVGGRACDAHVCDLTTMGLKQH